MAELADEAELPLLAHDDPALTGDRCHDALDDLAGRTWLARSDPGYLVLGREHGMALLRDRRHSFPSAELLELQAVFGSPTRVCPMRSLPVRFTPRGPG